RRASRVICFCRLGTRSSGSSTPRSPRATISASEASRISGSRSIACGFSILAITAARPRISFLASVTSSARCTKDSAIQSTPVTSAASRSARSLGVIGDQPHLAVIEQQRVARFERGEDFRMRQLDPRAVAGRLVGIERKTLAVLQLHRAFRERTQPEFRSLKVDQDADRPAITGFDVADGLHQLAHLVVRGMAHVDAEYVGAGFEQPPYHGAVGGSRAKRCEDLDA